MEKWKWHIEQSSGDGRDSAQTEDFELGTNFSLPSFPVIYGMTLSPYFHETKLIVFSFVFP